MAEQWRRIAGLKAAATKAERYTLAERQEWSRKGGSAKVPKGFAMNRKRASDAGRKHRKPL